MPPTTALLWYRRDLRVADHPALTRALRDFDRVVAVFVLDDALLHGRFASTPRTAFMLGCLHALDAQLHERGSGLVLRQGDPATQLVALASEAGAQAVLWTSDTAPYARARDARVSGALRDAGIQALAQGGSYVVDVWRPRTRGGTPFVAFSPFHRHWLGLERRTVHRAPAQLPALLSALRKGRLPSLDALGVAGAALAQPFCDPGGGGARGARSLARRAGRPLPRAPRRARRAGHQRVVGLSALGLLEFQEKYRELEWADDDEALTAWREGRTGYPLVDGDYVRAWVPELRDVPLERLVEPWMMSDEEQAAAGCVIGEDYPAPIVDHGAERRRAVARYRAAGEA